ncbi:IclR family transcriptional regulator [Cupriavidus sp. CP313]
MIPARFPDSTMASNVPSPRRKPVVQPAHDDAPVAVLRDPGDRQFASTLERGLRVLQCFSSDSPELGNTEIALRTGLPKPTVSRLTHTLVRIGYLRRNPETGEFGLGSSVLCLGYPLLAGLQLRQLAAGPMKALADAVDGSVAIHVRDRLRMVALENIITRDVLRRKPGAGLTVPLTQSTAGTTWLIGAATEERNRAIREIEHAEPGSWSALGQELEAFRKHYLRFGYVKRRNVMRPNTTAVGVPLRRRTGGELLILSCVFVVPAGSEDAVEASAARALLSAAGEIGARLTEK